MSRLDPLTLPLWRACLAGDLPTIEDIMSRGADAHVKERNGETCLHMTASSGEVEAIEIMVEEGLDLDTANHNGQTPLHVAIKKDHLAVVRYIVRHGGNLDLTTKFSGMTGLHMACKDNNEDVVKFLLDNGANCAIKDKIQRYADFYSSNKTILATFDDHFPVCTHGRRKDQHQNASNTSSYLLDGIMDTETDLSHIYKVSADIPEASHAQRRSKAADITISRDASGTAVIDDGEEVEKARSKHQRGDRDREGLPYNEWDHGDVTIYDKMEKYEVDRDKQNLELAKQDSKKIKVNHKMGFSDEHKKRMQQNVFDRLLGSKAKKKDDPN